MIYIAYGTINMKTAPWGYIKDIDGFFDGFVEDDWMANDWAKQVIKEIDKSDLVAPKVVESPILGQIPYTWISGGAKLLIMMNMESDIVYDGDNLGDNCWPLLMQLGRDKDIAISLSYSPSFEWQFGCKIINIDTGHEIVDYKDFMINHIKSDNIHKTREFNSIKWPIVVNNERFKPPEIDF